MKIYTLNLFLYIEKLFEDLNYIRMIRYVKFLYLLAPLALLNGCYKLDTVPYDRISSETFWQTPDHAKQGIMGVYADLRTVDGFGKNIITTTWANWGWPGSKVLITTV